MKACIVTPFHDPRWTSNALANVARAGLPAVFALNGAARGLSLPGVASVECEDNQASGLNAGMAWAREQGFDAALSFDSDDYYGEAYAAKLLNGLRHADVVGQVGVFTTLADGLHYFGRRGRSMLFATVGFRLERAQPVVDTLDSCHDWSQRLKAAGASFLTLGPAHYCYRRHGRNAHWSLHSETLVRAAWGPALHYPWATETTVDVPPSDESWGRYVFRDPPSYEDIMRELRSC